MCVRRHGHRSSPLLDVAGHRSSPLLDVAGVRYLIGDQLTIADLFICHYRSLIGQPEFWHLCRHWFEGPDAVGFQRYYQGMLDGAVGAYFAQRYGSGREANAKEVESIVTKETRFGTKRLNYPFQW